MEYEINLEDLLAKISLFKAIDRDDLFVGNREIDLDTAEEINNTYIFAVHRGYTQNTDDRKLVRYVTDFVLENLLKSKED